MSQFPFRHKYLWGKRHAHYHLSVTHRFWAGVGAPACRTCDPIQSVWSQQTRKPEERKDIWPWYGVKKERNNVTHRSQDIYRSPVFFGSVAHADFPQIWSGVIPFDFLFLFDCFLFWRRWRDVSRSVIGTRKKIPLSPLNGKRSWRRLWLFEVTG